MTLDIEGATASLFRRRASASGDANDYFLSVADLTASLTLFPGGFDLLVRGGELRLPSEFFSADASGSSRPAVGAGRPDHPLALHFREPSQLSFSGSFTFQNFRARLPTPSGEDFIVRLRTATLVFAGGERPALKEVSGSLTVPLPDGTKAEVGFADVEWDLEGLPTGEIALLRELEVKLGGEFVLSLLARETRPGARVPGTRLSVTRGGDASLPHTQFRFGDDTLPLRELLAPTNLTLGLSLEVAVPVGEKAGLMGRVDGVLANIESNGLPRVSLQGVGFGVENLTIGNTILSGIVYLGGLTGDPRDLFCVGKLGGTMNGTGVSALVGFQLEPPMPLGVCLDVSGGSSGIPLGQTGILLTGVSGGISFGNTNGSPCDFKNYLPHDAEGRPTGPKTKAPGEVAPAVKGQLDASNPIAAPGCPCSCPPPSMNVFCQPHPDRERFPERAIIKFSSLDERFLETCLRPLQVTLPNMGMADYNRLKTIRLRTPNEVESAAAAINSLAGAMIQDGVRQLWPDASGDLPREIQDKLQLAQTELSSRLRRVLRETGGDRTLWEVIRDEAYRGLPCPDMTVEVTATFSYTGVSAFLSITGRCSLSTTGAVGVVGWLNLVGIRVGRFKGFLVATSEEGDLDPAVCGELNVSVGPVEFGKMNAQLGLPWPHQGRARRARGDGERLRRPHRSGGVGRARASRQATGDHCRTQSRKAGPHP